MAVHAKSLCQVTAILTMSQMLPQAAVLRISRCTRDKIITLDLLRGKALLELNSASFPAICMKAALLPAACTTQHTVLPGHKQKPRSVSLHPTSSALATSGIAWLTWQPADCSVIYCCHGHGVLCMPCSQCPAACCVKDCVGTHRGSAVPAEPDTDSVITEQQR